MEKVVHRLDLVMPKKNGHAGGAIPPPERQRVGEDSLKLLFEIVAEHWGRAGGNPERWRGLRVFGAGGTPNLGMPTRACGGVYCWGRHGGMADDPEGSRGFSDDMDRFYVDYFQRSRWRAEGKDRHWLVRSRKNMERLVLPKRREGRFYPRHVKIKMSGSLRSPVLNRKRGLN